MARPETKPIGRKLGVRADKKSAIRPTWGWRRWIIPGQQDLWIERLREAAGASWALTERPGRARILLEAYVDSRAAAVALNKRWGGGVRAVNSREWIRTRPTPPTRIGKRLEIIHEGSPRRKRLTVARLHIPHGLAFGSGEHATTYMLLKALAGRADLSGASVLDLGTGSGILALAARLFGARKIVATDFDPDAVKTASQNEALNFLQPSIHWHRADVRNLRAANKYDLVLANLFSGILAESAARIAGCVVSGGQLWLSGILASQEREVAAAYRAQGLEFVRTVRRGKWVMIQWTSRIRPAAK